MCVRWRQKAGTGNNLGEGRPTAGGGAGVAWRLLSLSACLSSCMHVCVCDICTHLLFCLPTGVLSDLIGRKLSTFGASALAAVFTAACIGATNYWVLLALRLVTGERSALPVWHSMSAAGAAAHYVLCMSHTSPCMQLAHVSKSAACQLPCVLVPRLDVAMAVCRALSMTRGGCCRCCRHWRCRTGPGFLPAVHRNGGALLEGCGWNPDSGAHTVLECRQY